MLMSFPLHPLLPHQMPKLIGKLCKLLLLPNHMPKLMKKLLLVLPLLRLGKLPLL